MEFPQDHFIQVGRIKTRYWAGGHQGSAVVLIHGLGGFVESWTMNFAALAALHRVYALDLPGHGKTDKLANTAYDTESLAGFVKDFMGALGLEQAHLVGHSLGGAISTRLAMRHPALVDKLVLCGPAGFGRQAGLMLRISSVPLLGEYLTRPSLASTRATIKRLVFDSGVIPDEFINAYYQITSQPGMQAAFLAALRANGNLLGQKKSMFRVNLAGMPKIKNPVLIVWGREDQIVPAAQAEAAARGFPNARLQLYENCGHLAMIEQAEHFNELILDFLGEQAGR